MSFYLNLEIISILKQTITKIVQHYLPKQLTSRLSWTSVTMSQSARLETLPWTSRDPGSTLFWLRQRLNGGGGSETLWWRERVTWSVTSVSVSLSSHWLHHRPWIGINALTLIVMTAVGNNTSLHCCCCCWCWHGCCFATTAGVSPSTPLCYAWRSPVSRDQLHDCHELSHTQ